VRAWTAVNASFAWVHLIVDGWASGDACGGTDPPGAGARLNGPGRSLAGARISGYAPAMPRRSGQRRSTERRPAAQLEDDPGDGPAILDHALAADAKRAKRHRRARGAVEIVLDFLADVLGSLLP